MKIDSKDNEALLSGKAFDFLIRDYGFLLEYAKSDMNGFRHVYHGTHVAVTVCYESREAYVHVIMHRLVNDCIITDPFPYQLNVPLNNIGLDHIVKYRAPEDLTKPLYDETSDYFGAENAFESMVCRLAYNLKCYADDVLRGNFSVFAEVDGFVKGETGTG